MVERKRVIDDQLRTVIRIDGQGKFQYFVIISLRWTELFPPPTVGPIGAFAVNWAIGKVQHAVGRRSPERKVGVFTRGGWWPRARLRYRTRVADQHEAENLADELCTEIEAGVFRWQRP